MKRIFRIILLISISFFQFCNSQQLNNKLLVVTSADYPPFGYIKDSKIIGFDIDLIRMVAKKLKLKVEFKNIPHRNLIPSVKSGIVDLAISALTITEERKKNCDFSIPYYKEKGFAIIFKENSPINSASEIANKKIACQLGTTMWLWLKNNAKKTNIVSVDLNTEGIEMLKAGHVEGVFIDFLQAISFVKKNPSLKYKIIVNIDSYYGILFKKNSNLKAKVDKVLKSLLNGGEINRLEKKYNIQ